MALLSEYCRAVGEKFEMRKVVEANEVVVRAGRAGSSLKEEEKVALKGMR